jgi:hypothetical protein
VFAEEKVFTNRKWKREIMPVMVSQCWIAIDSEKVILLGLSLEIIIGNYGYLGIILILRKLCDLRYHYTNNCQNIDF